MIITMMIITGTGCCSKVLVASTGQARVDQALYMGIYARSGSPFLLLLYMYRSNLYQNIKPPPLADTLQTTMGRQSTGEKGEKHSTSISSPGEHPGGSG